MWWDTIVCAGVWMCDQLGESRSGQQTTTLGWVDGTRQVPTTASGLSGAESGGGAATQS